RRSAGRSTMARRFVSDFLLPLVRGGPLHVGRPLGLRAVQVLAAKLAPGAVATGGQDDDHDAAVELRELRATRARALLMDAAPPALDEVSLRLGAAVHDILALAHPSLEGDDADRARVRVAEAAFALADVGPPPSAAEAVARHTLLGRL